MRPIQRPTFTPARPRPVRGTGRGLAPLSPPHALPPSGPPPARGPGPRPPPPPPPPCPPQIVSGGTLCSASPVLPPHIPADTGWSTSAATAAYSAAVLVSAAAGAPAAAS